MPDDDQVMQTPSHRIEKDTFGDIPVPAERLWGAQTERSLHHFAISHEKMDPELIKALVIIKKSRGPCEWRVKVA